MNAINQLIAFLILVGPHNCYLHFQIIIIIIISLKFTFT